MWLHASQTFPYRRSVGGSSADGDTRMPPPQSHRAPRRVLRTPEFRPSAHELLPIAATEATAPSKGARVAHNAPVPRTHTASVSPPSQATQSSHQRRATSPPVATPTPFSPRSPGLDSVRGVCSPPGHPTSLQPAPRPTSVPTSVSVPAPHGRARRTGRRNVEPQGGGTRTWAMGETQQSLGQAAFTAVRRAHVGLLRRQYQRSVALEARTKAQQFGQRGTQGRHNDNDNDSDNDRGTGSDNHVASHDTAAAGVAVLSYRKLPVLLGDPPAHAGPFQQSKRVRPPPLAAAGGGGASGGAGGAGGAGVGAATAGSNHRVVPRVLQARRRSSFAAKSLLVGAGGTLLLVPPDLPVHVPPAPPQPQPQRHASPHSQQACLAIVPASGAGEEGNGSGLVLREEGKRRRRWHNSSGRRRHKQRHRHRRRPVGVDTAGSKRGHVPIVMDGADAAGLQCCPNAEDVVDTVRTNMLSTLSPAPTVDPTSSESMRRVAAAMKASRAHRGVVPTPLM